MPICRKRNAFTLIEVLLVTALIGMIGVALFNTFANGFKIWERHRKFVAEEDVLIFFEKVNQDLLNSVQFTQIPFKGEPDSLSFCTRLSTVDENSEEVIPKLGEVVYAFDSAKKTLTRRQGNYTQAILNDLGRDRELLHNVASLQFTYYYFDHNTIAQKQVVNSFIPRSILIEVDLIDNEENHRQLRKLINIPQGV